MATIILFAPLLGALICGFAWPVIGERAGQIIATLLLFLAAILSWFIFFSVGPEAEKIEIMRWIQSGTLQSSWAIRLDRLTAIMLIVVTNVSALVHLYSFGYMGHDKDSWYEGDHFAARFFSYLSLFTFAMLMLVTANDIVQLFFGWEGVGLASYLLIGFYYRKRSANAAAMKAFIVNRVGDVGFILGIAGLYLLTDSIDFDVMFGMAPQLAETKLGFAWGEWSAANVIGILLFVGAMGKSAQLFLHPWLPDAMEGPTPVSALIHAATMVTAGVFLVCRMSPIYEYAPQAAGFIVVIGALTALITATIGLVQNDIKRVIAYSTCSQLGYMFVAAGVGAYPVAIFHLFTHAFFKALLFLGSGSVIIACHHEQDMRNYGGLRKQLPWTYWAMLIGTLSITGVGIPLTIFGFSGFLSKDAVIETAWIGSDFAFWALVFAAALTSFYSWRLIFMTFYGKPRYDVHGHQPHESPASMLVPLGALAIGAIFAGAIWYNPFYGNTTEMESWFGMEPVAAQVETTTPAAQGAVTMLPMAGGEMQGETVISAAHHAPVWVKVSPFVAMLAGFIVAWLFYIRVPSLPGRLARQQQPLYHLFLNKWYFDHVYDFVFVRGGQWFGRLLWKKGDGGTIDGVINGISMGVVPFFTRVAARIQSGYIFHYAFAMVLGIVILVTWMTLSGGAG